MITQRSAAATLLCAAVTLPLNPAPIHAKGQVGELGYVNATGLVLSWSDTFVEAQRREARALDDRQQAYERCKNPGHSLGAAQAIGVGIGILRGRGVNWRSVLQPQRRSNARTDCGPAPGTGDVVAGVQIVDAASGNGGRYAVLARATFRRPGDNLVSGSGDFGGRCVALMDGAGNLIPVRSKVDPDPYGFANPFLPDPVKVLETRLATLESRIAMREQTANSAKAGLASLIAYDGRSGLCVTPQRQALPARPAALADAEIEEQAAGSCLDLLTRRQDPAKVIAAVRSVRQDFMITAMQRYRAHPASCASNVMTPQMRDFELRMICSMSDIACYGQIQTVLQQCMAAVRNSCGAPLEAWRRQVDAISRGPMAARAQCESTRLAVANAHRDIPVLRAELENARAQLANARAQHVGGALPLSQARCGG